MTPKDTLHIAPGLALDTDYVAGGTFGLLAKKGAGKTYTARVMGEEFWAAGVPFVGIDPMGAMWGMRSSADGKTDGIPVAIFGGDHGDAPLERHGGALMADLVVDEGLSMILDMSALGSRAAERQFAQDFLERLYRRNSELVHLLIDEADLFAPQQPQAGDRPLLGVTENIVRRGRNRGIGVTLITQRPAVLNKDVLTQVDGLVAMRITGLTDRKAIDEWVKGHGDDDQAAQVKATLSSLANGECWWWVPELAILQKVQVRASRTFDSSPTKKRGDKRRDPKGFADIDMDAIESKMAATIERAKASDPAELNKTIRQLRSQVGDLECALEQRPADPEPIEVPTPFVPDEVPAALACAKDVTEQLVSLAAQGAHALQATIDSLSDLTPSAPRPKPARPTPPPHLPATAPASEAGPPRYRQQEERQAGHNAGAAAPEDLNAPRQRIIDTIAWFEAIGITTPKRGAVAPLAGTTSTSSGFEKNLSGLRTRGLVEYPAGGRLALTPEGRALAHAPSGTPTSEELQAAVLSKLNPPRAAILRALIAAYPNPLSRDDLAADIGVSGSSSGFEKNLSGLRTLELIDYPGPGLVTALPVLFLETT